MHIAMQLSFLGVYNDSSAFEWLWLFLYLWVIEPCVH